MKELFDCEVGFSPMTSPNDKTRIMTVKSFLLYNNRAAQIPNAEGVFKLICSLIFEAV